jgi:hypothetical protein
MVIDNKIVHLITWVPETEEGRQLRDVAEILGDLGFPPDDVRRLVAGYLVNRFPEPNCTIDRGDLQNYLFSLTTDSLKRSGRESK